MQKQLCIFAAIALDSDALSNPKQRTIQSSNFLSESEFEVVHKRFRIYFVAFESEMSGGCPRCRPGDH